MQTGKLKRKEATPLWLQLLALAGVTAASMRRGKSYQDNLSGDVYSHNPVTEDFYLAQAVVILDTHLFDDLSARAIRLLHRIITEMKLNNIFWLCDDQVLIRKGAVSELKKREILFITEKKNLFIINPAKLRRGKVMASIMASVDHYSKDRDITALIDLHPPSKARISTGLAPDSYDIERGYV